MGRSKTHYHPKTISSYVESFNNIVRQIEELAKSGAKINPENFYPPVKQHKCKSHDLNMVEPDLCLALNNYINLRIKKANL